MPETFGQKARRWLKEFLRGAAAGIRKLVAMPAVRAILALLVIFLIGLYFNGNRAFFKLGTHRDMLRQYSVFGILACGMTLVIISGGIDLAVGSLLAMAAVAFSLLSIHHGLNPWLAIPLVLLLGAAAGSLSGGLIARFRMQPFIVTLAMMVFARGFAKFLSGGTKVSSMVPAADGGFRYAETPPIYGLIDSRILGGNLSVVTLIFFACLLVSWLVLSRLRLGRYMYAIGGNEEAARLSGVPVFSTKLITYGLCGFFAAVAGIAQAAQEYHGDPEAGTAYELTAIAIVVIGGTNLMGGRGGIGLTLIGTLTIGYLDKILSINAVEESSRLMLTGAIIVGAVLLQRGGRAK